MASVWLWRERNASPCRQGTDGSGCNEFPRVRCRWRWTAQDVMSAPDCKGKSRNRVVQARGSRDQSGRHNSTGVVTFCLCAGQGAQAKVKARGAGWKCRGTCVQVEEGAKAIVTRAVARDTWGSTEGRNGRCPEEELQGVLYSSNCRAGASRTVLEDFGYVFFLYTAV